MDKDEEDAVLRNLLVAADRYCIQRLKLICEDKLCRVIDVGTVQTTLELAERLSGTTATGWRRLAYGSLVLPGSCGQPWALVVSNVCPNDKCRRIQDSVSYAELLTQYLLGISGCSNFFSWISRSNFFSWISWLQPRIADCNLIQLFLEWN